MAQPTRLIVHAQGAQGEVAAYLPRLLRVFADAAAENGALSVISA